MNWQTKEIVNWLKEDRNFFCNRYNVDVKQLNASELEKEVKMLLIISGRVVQTASMDYLKNQAIKQLLKEVDWGEVVRDLREEDLN